MFPVKHTVIYTVFVITSVQNTCFCNVFNALASKNPAKSCYVQCFFHFWPFFHCRKATKMTQNSISIPSCAQTPKNLRKMSKTPPYSGLGAKSFLARPPAKADRRKFRSETSDNMVSWKAEVRRVRREKIRRKKMQMREKVGKSRFTVFFQWFVAPEGRKVGSLKRRVRTQLARWEMKKCTPLWREAHFQVKMYKTHQPRTTFGSWDVEKVHAVGAKHISKSKCTKHTNVGPLLEVEMLKKCTPLWREAHFQVKMYKAHQVRTTFGSCDVEKVHAVVARSTFRSQKC